MKNWPKEDRYSWEKSEVMKEFESKILSNYSFVEKFAQQKMHLPKPAEIKAVGDELAKVKKTVQEISSFTSAADDGQDAAKDHQCDSAEDCAICHGGKSDDGEYTDDEVKTAKKQILEELYRMADEAISSGNIKLAYKIERTIAEVEEE